MEPQGPATQDVLISCVLPLWPEKLSMGTHWIRAFSSLTEDFKPQELHLDQPPSDQTQMSLFELLVYFSGYEGNVWMPGSEELLSSLQHQITDTA